MTPREVTVVIEAAIWREEQEARQRKRQAWHIAALTRTEKFPRNLASFMREPKDPNKRQGPEEQRAFFHEFAGRANLKVEVHTKPILTYPVVPGTICG